MRRHIYLLLVTLLIVQLIGISNATTSYESGTQVIYEANTSESYLITVPASMKPGETSSVIVEGTFPSNKTLNVAADDTVTLTADINESDSRTLNIDFEVIKLKGSNKEQVNKTQEITVENISNAIFGSWSGHFNYQADFKSSLNLPPDTATVIYNADNLDPNIDYEPFEITSSNRAMIGYTGEENEDLVIPAAIYIDNGATMSLDAEQSNGTWYKVETIAGGAFANCNNLKSVIIAEGVTTMGNWTFSKSSNIESVVIPSTLEIIPHGAFCENTSLSDVVISDGVKIISLYAFIDTHSLKTITIPESVTSIIVGAFGSSGLTTVNYCGTEEQWSSILSWGAYSDAIETATINYNYKG